MSLWKHKQKLTGRETLRALKITTLQMFSFLVLAAKTRFALGRAAMTLLGRARRDIKTHWGVQNGIYR